MVGQPVSATSFGSLFHSRPVDGKNECRYMSVFACGMLSFSVCPLVVLQGRFMLSGRWMLDEFE